MLTHTYDDCLIYKEIHSQQDTEDLQTDIDALQTWERRCLMNVHPQKCQLLRITRKPSPIIAQYNIHGHVLEVADTAKYLGVTLHKHCAWSKYINQTAKKANNTRAFLQRNLRRAPTSVKKRAYETLVRPILEYASAVWDPHAEADIYKLDMVQRRYASYTCNNFGRTSSVTAMLQQIGWDTLHERRAKSRLAMQFRIAHNLVDIPAADHLQTYNSRKGNAAKFRVPYARTVAYRHSFFPDVTRMWNALPSDIVTAGSIDLLKKKTISARDQGPCKNTHLSLYI